MDTTCSVNTLTEKNIIELINMELTKNFYDLDIPSLKEVIVFLSNCDTPLGDLCNDILRNEKDFHFDDIEETWWYLNELKKQHGSHLDEPIRRLKTIYSTIYKS